MLPNLFATEAVLEPIDDASIDDFSMLLTKGMAVAHATTKARL